MFAKRYTGCGDDLLWRVDGPKVCADFDGIRAVGQRFDLRDYIFCALIAGWGGVGDDNLSTNQNAIRERGKKSLVLRMIRSNW